MTAKLIALVLPLGLDTFAVAAAIGMIGVGSSAGRRISVLHRLRSADAARPPRARSAAWARDRRAAEYLAISVLIAFGLDTHLSDDDDDERVAELVQMTGVRTIALGISITLDELAIGFTLGLLHVSAVLVMALIAVQTQLGLRLGSRLGQQIRESAERLAGVALTTLRIVLLAEKLLA